MKSAKKPLTLTLVGVFILWLIAALFAEPSHAVQPTVSLGHTVLNAHQTTGEVSLRTDDQRWEAALALLGDGNTKRGDSAVTPAVSLSRIVNPGWGALGGENFLRIGIAHVDDFPLVGQWNYRLGTGLRWGDRVELEYFHYSSAGINDLNTGMDGVQLRLLL